MPLSVKVDCGMPWWVQAARKVSRTLCPVSGDRLVGGRGDQETGVVVEPEQDLRVLTVVQRPVSEVGLPTLIGQVSFEPQPGAFGAFAWLWSDAAGAGQDPPDGGHPGWRVHLVGQEGGDGVRAGVSAVGGQFGAQG
jgi:hypothetical protein